MDGFLYKGPQRIITNGHLPGTDVITRFNYPDERTMRLMLHEYADKVIGLVFSYLLDADRERIEPEDYPEAKHIIELPSSVRGQLPDAEMLFYGASYNPAQALEETDAWAAWKQVSQTFPSLDIELLETIWNGYSAFEHIFHRNDPDAPETHKLVFVEAPPPEQTGGDLFEMFKPEADDYPYTVFQHCQWLGILPLLGIR